MNNQPNTEVIFHNITDANGNIVTDLVAQVMLEASERGYMVAQEAAVMALSGFLPDLDAFKAGALAVEFVGKHWGTLTALATFEADMAGSTEFPIKFNSEGAQQ